MAYKLVRTDVPNPYEIDLPEGFFIIGRRRFLGSEKCRDLKVSRKHAELTVTDTSVTLKSIHHNPCFYIKKDIDHLYVLHGTSIELCDGDKFALLQNKYWYKVICTQEMDDATNTASQPINTPMATPDPQPDDAPSASTSHKRKHSPENNKQEGESSNKVIIIDD